MLKELLASHPSDFDQDKTTLEKLVRAQHYGLPTRLLDVTRNPLAALYFACSVNKTLEKRETTGEIIVFLPKMSRQKYFDSDTVSCISNLGLMTSTQRLEIEKHVLTSREEAFGKYPDNEIEFNRSWVQFFNNSDDVKRLAHLVAVERPGFVSRIDPRDIANTFAVVPRKLNNRLAAQEGEFLIFGLRFDPKQFLFVDQIEIKEIYISGPKKQAILDELRTLTISEELLFPEIDKTAKNIASTFS